MPAAFRALGHRNYQLFFGGQLISLTGTWMQMVAQSWLVAVYAMMFLGMAPIGALVAGWLAERVGAANTVTMGGVGCILSAIVFSLRLPALRREARKLLAPDSSTPVAGPTH